MTDQGNPADAAGWDRAQPYLDAAEGQAEGVAHEAYMLGCLLESAWEKMGPASRGALLAHPDVLMTHAAAQGCDEGDEEFKAPTSLDDLKSVAARHGSDSEEEHEVGDIQAYIVAAAETATDAEWDEITGSAQVQALLSGAAPSP